MADVIQVKSDQLYWSELFKQSGPSPLIHIYDFLPPLEQARFRTLNRSCVKLEVIKRKQQVAQMDPQWRNLFFADEDQWNVQPVGIDQWQDYYNQLRKDPQWQARFSENPDQFFAAAKKELADQYLRYTDQSVRKAQTVMRRLQGYLAPEQRTLLQAPPQTLPIQEVDHLATEIAEKRAQVLVDWFEALVPYFQQHPLVPPNPMHEAAIQFLNDLPEPLSFRERAKKIREWLQDPHHQAFYEVPEEAIPALVRDPVTQQIQAMPVNQIAQQDAEAIQDIIRQHILIPPEASRFSNGAYKMLAIYKDQTDVIQVFYSRADTFEKVHILREIAQAGNLDTLKYLLQLSPVDDLEFRRAIDERLSDYFTADIPPEIPPEYIHWEFRTACWKHLFSLGTTEGITQALFFETYRTLPLLEEPLLNPLRALIDHTSEGGIDQGHIDAVNSPSLLQVLQILIPRLPPESVNSLVLLKAMDSPHASSLLPLLIARITQEEIRAVILAAIEGKNLSPLIHDLLPHATQDTINLAFTAAAQEVRIQIVQALLPHATQDTIDGVFIIVAGKEGRIQIVQALFPHVTQHTINLAFIAAAQEVHIQIVQALLPHATQDIIDGVFAVAEKEGRIQTVQALLPHVAQDIIDLVVARAVKNRNIQIVSLILSSNTLKEISLSTFIRILFLRDAALAAAAFRKLDASAILGIGALGGVLAYLLEPALTNLLSSLT